MDTAAASLGSGTVVRQDGEDFAIDWGQKWAHCPRGRLSMGWKEYTDADRSPYVSIRFSASPRIAGIAQCGRSIPARRSRAGT